MNVYGGGTLIGPDVAPMMGPDVAPTTDGNVTEPEFDNVYPDILSLFVEDFLRKLRLVVQHIERHC